MRLSDLPIQTGDLFLVDGGGNLVSSMIEVLTDGRFSHVGIFYRSAEGGLWVAEELQFEGFRATQAERRIKGEPGMCFWGCSPIQAQHRLDAATVINRYLDQRPRYGYETLLLTLLADLGVKLDPLKVRPVCSTFAQLVLEAAGVKTTGHLMSPDDVGDLATRLEVIEK